MPAMTIEEAKQLVKEYMDKIKGEGFAPTLLDINDCIKMLRELGFYVTIDGTNKIIGDALMDGKGNPNFSVIGEIKR